MKTNFKIILTFIVIIVIIIFTASWFVWNNLPKSKKEVQKCGNVIIERYLATRCPWQATPWLEEATSSFGGRCSLDIWLSESKPEGPIPEICNHSPLTSKCLLEGIASFNPWGDINNRRVTLVGNYKKMKVCHLLKKCSEPECSECADENVFVPCELVEK